MSTEPAPEPLTDALAVDLGQTHDHEIGLHDRFEFVFRAQAEALIARGWTLATPSSVTPSEPTPAEPLCTCGAPRSHGSHRTDHTFRASVTPSEPTLDAAWKQVEAMSGGGRMSLNRFEDDSYEATCWPFDRADTLAATGKTALIAVANLAARLRSAPSRSRD